MRLDSIIPLRAILKRLSDSSFLRNVAIVGGGIAAAQAITLLFMPLLTRLYGPEAFGVLASYEAIIKIAAPLATVGYASAIVMPADDRDAAAVVRLSLYSVAVIFFVSFGVVSIWGGYVVELFNWEESFGYVLYLIPLGILISGILAVANQVAVRKGLYKSKAVSLVASNFVANASKVVCGLVVPSGFALALLTFFGRVCNVGMQLVYVPHSGGLALKAWLWGGGIKKAACSYKDFALYRMPQGVIKAISAGLPVIALTTFFGASSAGQYSITLLALGAPVTLLGESVREVFYPKITRHIEARKDGAVFLILQAMALLFGLAIIPFGLLAFYGDYILPWVLGGEWVRAGEYSQWIAVWMFFVLIAEPAIAAIPILKRQGTLLLYEVFVTAAKVVALYVGFIRGDDLDAIAMFSLVSIAGCLFISIVVLAQAKRIEVSATNE